MTRTHLIAFGPIIVSVISIWFRLAEVEKKIDLINENLIIRGMEVTEQNRPAQPIEEKRQPTSQAMIPPEFRIVAPVKYHSTK